jgi:hypothetical protein
MGGSKALTRKSRPGWWLVALFASQLRRAWGVAVVREMARHRLVRLPRIGAPRGTRLSQALAQVAHATMRQRAELMI